jgi:hypothetical protein
MNREVGAESNPVDPILKLKPLSSIPVAVSAPLQDGNCFSVDKQSYNRVNAAADY